MLHPTVETRLQVVANILEGYRTANQIRQKLLDYGLDSNTTAEEISDATISRGDLKAIFGVDDEDGTPMFVANQAIAAMYGSQKHKVQEAGQKVTAKAVHRVATPILTLEQLEKELFFLFDMKRDKEAYLDRPCYIASTNFSNLVIPVGISPFKNIEVSTEPVNLQGFPVVMWGPTVISALRGEKAKLVLPDYVAKPSEVMGSSPGRSVLSTGSFAEIVEQSGLKVEKPAEVDENLLKWIKTELTQIRPSSYYHQPDTLEAAMEPFLRDVKKALEELKGSIDQMRKSHDIGQILQDWAALVRDVSPAVSATVPVEVKIGPEPTKTKRRQPPKSDPILECKQTLEDSNLPVPSSVQEHSFLKNKEINA
jgi:hypothetical protein